MRLCELSPLRYSSVFVAASHNQEGLQITNSRNVCDAPSPHCDQLEFTRIWKFVRRRETGSALTRPRVAGILASGFGPHSAPGTPESSIIKAPGNVDLISRSVRQGSVTPRPIHILRSWPTQYRSRTFRLSTLLTPLLGKLSQNSTVFGTL